MQLYALIMTMVLKNDPGGRPWPRGHILMSLALASKPQVLENCLVLGSRTAVFFELSKFCALPEKFFQDLFVLENTCVCVLGSWPWLPRAFLSLASRGSVLGNTILGLGLGFFLCPWPRALCP